MQTNNKLREALELFAHMNDGDFYDKSPVVRSIVNKARAALAEPVRNYEVGTVEEQYSRMYRECYEWMCMDCKQSDKDLRKCALSWAQKPYKEGGAK